MFEDHYLVVGDFLIKYSEPSIVATDGKTSYSAETEDSLTIAYLKQEKENSESFAVHGSDKGDLTLSFDQLRGKIKLNRVSVVLNAMPQVMPLLPWVSAMNNQITELQRRTNDLTSRIERQDTLLDEMITAKQENQNELLKRVYTLINGKIKQEEKDNEE